MKKGNCTFDFTLVMNLRCLQLEPLLKLKSPFDNSNQGCQCLIFVNTLNQVCQKNKQSSLEHPALTASLAKYLIVWHPLNAVTCLSFFWWFSSRSIHYFPPPDGGPLSADSYTIQLLSKRVQQEEWSALDARGAQESAQRNAFSYPTCTQAIEQFPIQTLLYYSSPGEYCDYLYHLSTYSLTHSFELLTLKTVRSTVHIWCFNDISGLLKDIQFECDKPAKTKRGCCVLCFQNVTSDTTGQQLLSNILPNQVS